MEKYQLAPPEFIDNRGSFIVNLYKAYQSSVDNPALDEDTKNLILFCKTPRNRKEICNYLGLASATYAIQRYVMPLVEVGKIKLSMPDKPKSSKQMYYSE